MSLVCKYCGSDNLGWDAIVDQNDGLIVTFDHYSCLNCEKQEPELEVLHENFDEETNKTSQAICAGSFA
jgi:hypothetical protein